MAGCIKSSGNLYNYLIVFGPYSVRVQHQLSNINNGQQNTILFKHPKIDIPI